MNPKKATGAATSSSQTSNDGKSRTKTSQSGSNPGASGILKTEYKDGRYRIKICENKDLFTKFTVYNRVSTASFNVIWISLNIFAICGFFVFFATLDIVSILSQHTLECLAFLVGLISLNLVLLNYNGSQLKKESLIITKNVGVTIEKKNFNGKSHNEFFCVQNMRDLVINEGLTPYDVRYYMVLIAKESDSLIQLFSSFDLRLADLLKIYYPARKELLSDIQKK